MFFSPLQREHQLEEERAREEQARRERERAEDEARRERERIEEEARQARLQEEREREEAQRREDEREKRHQAAAARARREEEERQLAEQQARERVRWVKSPGRGRANTHFAMPLHRPLRRCVRAGSRKTWKRRTSDTASRTRKGDARILNARCGALGRCFNTPRLLIALVLSFSLCLRLLSAQQIALKRREQNMEVDAAQHGSSEHAGSGDEEDTDARPRLMSAVVVPRKPHKSVFDRLKR